MLSHSFARTSRKRSRRKAQTVSRRRVSMESLEDRRMLASLHGQKWLDVNEDGVRDPGDEGLNDWLINLYDASNGQLVDSQLTHEMDLNNDNQIDPMTEQGLYWFENLDPGCYYVEEVLQTGWTQTYPPPPAGFTGIRIGDADGFGFDDGGSHTRATTPPAPGSVNVDGVGVLAPGDYLPDLNESGVVAHTQGDNFDNRSVDEFDRRFLEIGASHDTGSVGSQWTDISLSTTYTESVSPHPAPSFPDLTPGLNPQNAIDAPNEPVLRFDFHVPASDLSVGEPLFFNIVFGDYDIPQDDAKIEISDANGDVLTLDLVAGAASPPGTISQPHDGLIQSAFLKLDFEQVFRESGTGYDGFLEVRLQARTEPYMAFDYAELSTLPAFVTPASNGHLVALSDGQTLEQLDFGNHAEGVLQGQKWYDLDGDGVRSLGEPGWDGVEIQVIDANTGALVASQMTDAEDLNNDNFFDPYSEQGLFSFTLPPGDYLVQEVAPGGAQQTFPSFPAYSVEVSPGETISDLDFGNISSGIGNFELGEIHGCKFNDLNGNGSHDPGEPGMAGITIELLIYDVASGSYEVHETTVTGADGEYWFMDLGPGYYQVSEVLPSGMISTTTPLPPFQLQSGQVVTFGDCPPLRTSAADSVSGLSSPAAAATVQGGLVAPPAHLLADFPALPVASSSAPPNDGERSPDSDRNDRIVDDFLQLFDRENDRDADRESLLTDVEPDASAPWLDEVETLFLGYLEMSQSRRRFLT